MYVCVSRESSIKILLNFYFLFPKYKKLKKKRNDSYAKTYYQPTEKRHFNTPVNT